jgi:hypothetical protein
VLVDIKTARKLGSVEAAYMGIGKAQLGAENLLFQSSFKSPFGELHQ